MKQAAALICLFAGILFESMLWDDPIMQSPDELTVSEFEQAECGLSVVLTNAIEDQCAVVDQLQKARDEAHQHWFQANNLGFGLVAEVNKKIMDESAESLFRAMRVLGLLRDTREREAGQVT